jgi:hypothetical protein
VLQRHTTISKCQCVISQIALKDKLSELLEHHYRGLLTGHTYTLMFYEPARYVYSADTKASIHERAWVDPERSFSHVTARLSLPGTPRRRCK